MLRPRDWISFCIGIVIGALGLLPILHKIGAGPGWFAMEWLPVALFSYIAAGAGFYLIINSIVEITNSNIVGWISFMAAAAITLSGVLHVLGSKGILSGFLAFGWLSSTIYHVIFVILGVFLVIATFAMEL